MHDLVSNSTKYYSVHVGTDNILKGEHYVPFPDDVLIKIKQEFEENERNHFTLDMSTLNAFMDNYIKETFPKDLPSGRVSYWMEVFEPVDMEAIMRIPDQPREVDVDINIGEDNCFELSLWCVREEIEYDEGKLDISCIESPQGDVNQSNLRIQIHRLNNLLPHRDKWIHIENKTYPYWDLNGYIESIEQNDNVTTYQCKNSLFPFYVVVTWHMLYLYDGHIPICKGF